MNLKRYSMLPLVLMALPAMSLTLERGNFKIVTPVGSPAPVKLAANSLARDFGKVMRWIPDVDSVMANDGKTINIITLDATDAKNIEGLNLKPLDEHLIDSHRQLKNARKALHSSQHGVFDTWYATDRIFGL
ncbi:MAG: hypothetical protein K2K95_13265, partial [Muribaculaceae bacterium]|nr:hypothetical protein [Muribaculaceae bacterium]